MDPNSASSASPRKHFHIRWSRKDSLDWQGVDTRREAVERAVELAAPAEMFTIEEIDSDCPYCRVQSVEAAG